MTHEAPTFCNEAKALKLIVIFYLKYGTALAALYAATFFTLSAYGPDAPILTSLTLGPLLVWISVKDILAYEIPDIGVLCVALLSLPTLYTLELGHLAIRVLSSTLVTALLWGIGEVYFRLKHREGLGIGDAKLVGASALLISPEKLPLLLLLSSCGGICAALLQRATSSTEDLGIPFGPFIAYAVFVLYLTPNWFSF